MDSDILNTNKELENNRVLILPFENGRSQELKEIIFQEQIWKYMGMSMKNEMDFDSDVENTLKEKANGDSYPFIIIDKKVDRVAGSTRYGYLNKANQKCEIGCTWYGPEFQGTGLNKACKYELLKFGFETVGLRRIQFSTDEKNLKSQRAIEKLEAKREGLFRNNYIAPNAESRNDVYFSIIKEDWNLIKSGRFAKF